MTTYKGIRTDDENKILYEGRAIRKVASNGGTDKLEWGYRGRGPMNSAVSILFHAVKLESTPVDSTESLDRVNFMTTFISPLPDDEWELDVDDIVGWMEDQLE